jgi:N utilization substance protein A
LWQWRGKPIPPPIMSGHGTKIAVDTLDRDVDPVGACIGARGSRIQVVVNELRGEKNRRDSLVS